MMKFFNGTAPAYADEIFHPADQSRITRRSKFRLKVPFRMSSTGHKFLSYQGPKIWNSLASDLKSTNNVNTFKHKIKEISSKIYKGRNVMYMCIINTSHTLLLPIWFKLKIFQHMLELSFLPLKFSFHCHLWRDHYGNKVALTF